MIDIVFDIDGTLADASHRLHFIKDPNYWVAPNGNQLVPRKPNWDSFLSDEQVAKDAPIPQTWDLLTHILQKSYTHRAIFITSRPERARLMTFTWLTNPTCPVRRPAYQAW